MLAFPGMDTTAEVLRAATLDLTRTLDFDEVLDKLLAHLDRLVPYDTANVMLVDEDESRLAVRAIRGYEAWGDPDAVRQDSFALDYHPAPHPGPAGAPEPPDPGDPRGRRAGSGTPGADHVRSWMGVPLLAGDRVIGLYAVDKSDAGLLHRGARAAHGGPGPPRRHRHRQRAAVRAAASR